jgi:hypothetical protein
VEEFSYPSFDVPQHGVFSSVISAKATARGTAASPSSGRSALVSVPANPKKNSET